MALERCSETKKIPPPPTSDQEISVDLPGKKRQGKGENGEEKKENYISKGGKWKEGKLQFFFFFFSRWEKIRKNDLGPPPKNFLVTPDSILRDNLIKLKFITGATFELNVWCRNMEVVNMALIDCDA